MVSLRQFLDDLKRHPQVSLKERNPLFFRLQFLSLFLHNCDLGLTPTFERRFVRLKVLLFLSQVLNLDPDTALHSVELFFLLLD